MYRVMVVDDEMIVRLAIREIISNAECDFEIAYEAENGRQALQLYEEQGFVDIVLTDITMPILNGIELTRALMKKEPAPLVIAISSYNDYALVRDAFTLGAKDYILKDSLNEENLLTLLNKLAKEEQITRQQQTRNLQYEKEVFLKNLLEDTADDGIEETWSALKIRLNPQDITLCAILIDGYREVKESRGSGGTSIKTLMQDAMLQLLEGKRKGEVLVLSEQEYLLMLSMDVTGTQAYMDGVDGLLRQLRYHLNHYANIKITVGISSRGDRKTLPRLYEEAGSNANLRFILGKNHSIYPWTKDQVTSGREAQTDIKIGELIEALKMQLEDEATEKLSQVLERISRSPAADIGKIYYNYMELIFRMNKFMEDSGFSMEDVYGHDMNFYEKIQRFETTAEINTWLGNIIRFLLAFLKERQGAGIKNQMERAQEFIRKNYDKDLPLKVVSDYVSLSENYFSAQFFKYSGKNFSEYLSNIRIEKAKKYLETTDLKMYEICQRIGYANVEHFSRVFKKAVGVSPLKYRKQ